MKKYVVKTEHGWIYDSIPGHSRDDQTYAYCMRKEDAMIIENDDLDYPIFIPDGDEIEFCRIYEFDK